MKELETTIDIIQKKIYAITAMSDDERNKTFAELRKHEFDLFVKIHQDGKKQILNNETSKDAIKRLFSKLH
jgi:hypothetical protein